MYLKLLTHLLQKLPLPEEKIVRDWRLNERHYGALTGLNKGKKNRIDSASKKFNFSGVCPGIWHQASSDMAPII